MFLVHDYTNRDDSSSTYMAASQAKVEVYLDGQLARVFNVPKNIVGTYWHVFDYDIARKTITEFKNSTASNQIKAGEYCIHVVDENGAVVSGATVKYGSENGTTNQNGDAVFTRFTVGNPTIKVEKAGYITWSNANSNWKKSGDHFDTIILYPTGASPYKLAWARYSNLGTNVNFDILSKTKKLNLKNDGNLIGDLDFGNFYITCASVQTGSVDHYELWQNSKKIATSASGDFGKLSVKSFSKGGGCFIRVVSKDGKTQVDTHINLEFAENKAQKENSISLKGNKISFTVSDDIPFFGGSKLDFQLPIQSKVQFVASDEKIQIGINMNLAGGDTDKETAKKFHDLVRRTKRLGGQLSGSDERILNSLVKTQNKWQLFGKDSVKVDFVGYGEANWGSRTATVDLLLRVKVKAADLSYTTWVVVVPVTVQLEANLEAGFEATVQYDFASSTLNGELDFNLDVEIKAFGGVGIGKLVGVGVYGSAKLETSAHLLDPPIYVKKVDLTGELGLKAYIGWLTYEKAFAHNTWHLYTANNVHGVGLMESGEPWLAGLYDAGEWETQDLGYLAAESDWLGETSAALMASNARTAFSSLLTDTYRNAKPVMISDGSALYAAFIRADASTGSRYVAVTKFNGSTWSTPVRVDSGAILDDAPTLCVGSDGTIYLAYAKTVSDPGDSLVTYAKKQKIVVGTIDPSTLTFTAKKTYSGSGYAHMQQLAVLGGKPVLMWADTAVTDESSVLSPASGTIYYADCTGGTWSTAKKLVNVSTPVSSVTAGLLDGKIAAAYVSDGTLYSVKAGGQPSALAQDVSGHVAYGTLPGTSGAAFLWNGAGSLNASNGKSVAAEGITGEYAVVGNRIYYSTPTDSSANLAVLQYENGRWGLPVRLTGDSRYLENLSAARMNGTDYVFGMHTAVTIAEGSVEDAKNLVWSRVMPASDLRVDGVDYETDGLAAGQSVPVTLTVTNAGDHAVSSVRVTVNGGSATTHSVNLQPGESAELTINMTCPAALTTYTLNAVETGQDDYTPEDNACELALGYADAAVELVYQQIGTGRALVATVTNEGVAPASGSIIIFDANGDPVKEGSFDDLAPGDATIVTYAVSENFAGLDGGDVSVKVTLHQEEIYTYNNADTIHIMDR